MQAPTDARPAAPAIPDADPAEPAAWSISGQTVATLEWDGHRLVLPMAYRVEYRDGRLVQTWSLPDGSASERFMSGTGRPAAMRRAFLRLLAARRGHRG